MNMGVSFFRWFDRNGRPFQRFCIHFAPFGLRLGDA